MMRQIYDIRSCYSIKIINCLWSGALENKLMELILFWKDLRLHDKVFPEERVFTLHV